MKYTVEALIYPKERSRRDVDENECLKMKMTVDAVDALISRSIFMLLFRRSEKLISDRLPS